MPAATTPKPKTKPKSKLPKPLRPKGKQLPDCRVYVGDCRELLPNIPECARSQVDLVFADPPFNWARGYDKWDDSMPDEEYCNVTQSFGPPGEVTAFTQRWIDLCIEALTPTGSLWINIPDDWAAEIVVHLKRRGLHMVNWCVWHYRFGQNTTGRFINSKVHALYFCKDPRNRTWNAGAVLEPSDRASTYFDPRTMDKKDGMPAGMRVPMDVWYGQYWGRIQGNNLERRGKHDNQLPELYLSRVVQCSSNEGDLVLDPFTGSGTTAVAATALGRRYVGCEYSPDMARSAIERVSNGPVRDLRAPAQATAIFKPRKRRMATEKEA
ncbi:MAG: site-specific DNA-methyltransferase [Phycisphaera sp.]|nr:MAG: site-specific DNA-methyltransferase [Phycisphaera sp.]